MTRGQPGVIRGLCSLLHDSDLLPTKALCLNRGRTLRFRPLLDSASGSVCLWPQSLLPLFWPLSYGPWNSPPVHSEPGLPGCSATAPPWRRGRRPGPGADTHHHLLLPEIVLCLPPGPLLRREEAVTPEGDGGKGVLEEAPSSGPPLPPQIASPAPGFGLPGARGLQPWACGTWLPPPLALSALEIPRCLSPWRPLTAAPVA